MDAVSAAMTKSRFLNAFFLQFFDCFSDAFVVGFDQMRASVDGGYGFTEVRGYRCRHVEYARMRAADDDREGCTAVVHEADFVVEKIRDGIAGDSFYEAFGNRFECTSSFSKVKFSNRSVGAEGMRFLFSPAGC